MNSCSSRVVSGWLEVVVVEVVKAVTVCDCCTRSWDMSGEEEDEEEEEETYEEVEEDESSSTGG